MNKVIIVGRLTRDPEVRYTQTGKAVANFSIAVDSGFGDNKRTDFIPVVVWDKLAEICGNNLTKGRRVLVEGKLQIGEYEKEGVKRKTADVIAQNVEFLDGKKDTTEQVEKPMGQNMAGGYDVSSIGTDATEDFEW